MKKVIIISHKNQDTDSVAASMALAELFGRKKIYQARAAVFGSLNRETEYVLNRFNLKKPQKVALSKKQPVFLVDFNEKEQSPAAFSGLVIEGLVDHHKLNMCFSKEYPVIFRVEPVGSSCTIVGKMYRDYGAEPDKKTAGLLVSGIVSDTLKFSSPTTTEEDEKLARELARKHGINIEKLAREMFEAKSDLSGISANKLITMDYKEFKFAKFKTGIGVLETVNPKMALQREREIRKALSEHKRKSRIDLVFFGLVDIVNNNTDLILIGEPEEQAAIKVFKKYPVKDGIMRLLGVVSRKKQLVPEFEKKLK
ncbi:MAG: manganese-dependent inorganic pyrophosphatase [Patescibacteria group bacterium]|nr:manganese-dependent inorganic pyrophosphatase [Patescibacteria group bacterium]